MRPILIRRALALAATLVALATAIPARADVAPPASDHWVIEAPEARALIADGALLLDARPADARDAGPLAGAEPVEWTAFTNPDLPDKGKLLDDDAALTERLRDLGVSPDRPVVVVADPKASWGEDGRIVWTLRTLGHDRAFLVDGGVAALLAEGPVTAAPAGAGTFTVARTDAYGITKEALAAALGDPSVVILDTREDREFAGETPYGETRGGHVPGARHVFYRDLVAADGTVLKGEALRARLSDLGIAGDSTVVSYCTGGIRSGFVTAVLRDAGIDARNYAGSMWEWSAAPAADYPLVTE